MLSCGVLKINLFIFLWTFTDATTHIQPTLRLYNPDESATTSTAVSRHVDLMRRQEPTTTAANPVCGYVNGNQAWPWSCNAPGYGCFFDNSSYAFGCCTDSNNCTLDQAPQACYDYADAAECVGACDGIAPAARVCSSAKPYCGLALWSGIVSSTTITYSQLACGTARTIVNNIYPQPTYSSTGIMPVQTSMAGVFGTIINPTTTATTTATSSSTSNAANGNSYGCGSSESNITSPSCFMNAEIVTLKCWGGLSDRHHPDQCSAGLLAGGKIATGTVGADDFATMPSLNCDCKTNYIDEWGNNVFNTDYGTDTNCVCCNTKQRATSAMITDYANTGSLTLNIACPSDADGNSLNHGARAFLLDNMRAVIVVAIVGRLLIAAY